MAGIYYYNAVISSSVLYAILSFFSSQSALGKGVIQQNYAAGKELNVLKECKDARDQTNF